MNPTLLLAIPLLPLLAAIVRRPCSARSSAAPARTRHHPRRWRISCACCRSWVLQAALLGRRAHLQRTGLHLAGERRHAHPGGLPHRPADGADDGGGDLRLAVRARLHHRLHGRRPRLPALLQLHLAVHLLDADAGDGEQLHAAVLRLGSGGRGVLPADRLLVHAPDAPSSPTSRRSSSTASATSASCSASPASSTTPTRWTTSAAFAAAPQIAHADASRSPRTTQRRRAHADLHLPVHRRHGQVGAGAAARVAAGLDGRPDADLGTDPRGHHGDRRHLHGGAHVAAVRALGQGAVVRAGHRRDHGLLHGPARRRQQRHQARDRLLDALAARLHDRGAGRVGLQRRRSST